MESGGHRARIEGSPCLHSTVRVQALGDNLAHRLGERAAAAQLLFAAVLELDGS
jgi:hypothetical protein